MKYLVNRKTKEHRISGDDWQNTDTDHWKIVQADSEGWITHTGTECPLPDDAKCDYLMKNGMQMTTIGTAKSLAWRHHNYPSDITHYRPILTEQAEPVQEPEPIPEPSLFEKLAAAHKHAQTIPDLEAELRELLGSMGYDLVSRNPFVEPAEISKRMESYHKDFMSLCSQVRDPQAEAAVEPDMTNWRNWWEGDKVEVVGLVDSHLQRFYPLGSIRSVTTDHQGDFGVGDTTGDVLSCGRFGHMNFKPECFRFHSRPAKGNTI